MVHVLSCIFIQKRPFSTWHIVLNAFVLPIRHPPPPPAMIMRPKINKRISYKRPALLLSAEKLDQLLADLSNSHSNGKEYRGFVGIWPVQLLMLHTGASKCLWTFLVLLSCSTFDPGWLIVLHFNLRYCKQPHICVHQSLMGFIADPIHGRIYCNCKVCG